MWEVNFWAVIAATVVMFAIGAFWYMVPFGKTWGKIHGFDKLSKKEQERQQKAMGPWYGAQLVVHRYFGLRAGRTDRAVA